MGNGQPGRLGKLEKRVEAHETTMQRAAGIGVAVGSLLTLVHVGIDLLKLHK